MPETVGVLQPKTRGAFVFPGNHPKLKGGVPRVPIETVSRARNALKTYSEMKDAPDWWAGTIEELKTEVSQVVTESFPSIVPGVPFSAEALLLRAPGRFSLSSTELVGGGKIFNKDILRAGTFTHQGTGEKVSFTIADLKRLARNSNDRVKRVGQKCAFPDGHTNKATANLGHWFDFHVDEANAELRASVAVEDGPAAEKIGKTITDVSVEIVSNYTESDGTHYDDVIRHVAATPIPVINKQKNFEPVALSLSAQGVSLFVEDIPVTFAELKKSLNLAADASEEEIVAAVQALDVSAKTLESKVTEMSGQLDSLGKRLDLAETKEIESELRESMKEGKLTKAQFDTAKALLKVKGSVQLSSDGKTTEKPVADLVRDLIKNAAVGTPISPRDAISLGSDETESAEDEKLRVRKRAEALEHIRPGFRAQFSADGLDFNLVPTNGTTNP